MITQLTKDYSTKLSSITARLSMIFASDYDGTIRRNGIVTNQDREAIQTVMKDHIFCIVTGRSLGMIVNELAYYQIPYSYIIGNNGGLIATSDKKIIQRNDIDFNVACELIEELKQDERIMMGISDGDKYATIQVGQIEDNLEKHNEIVEGDESAATDLLNHQQINSFYVRHATKNQTLSLMEALQKKYVDKLSFHYNNGTLDIEAVNVSKPNGIAQLQTILNIEKAVAIGDGYNDISMIEAYGKCSMINAPEAVRQHATYLFDDIQDWINFSLN